MTEGRTGEPLVRISGLEVTYGNVRALKGVDLEIREGQICIVLGANGAGKSSIIRTVIGLVRAGAGTIEFPAGHRIAGRPPHEICRAGIAWVPEGRQVFPNLTVRENLEIGAFATSDKAGVRSRMQRVTDLFPRLEERMKQAAGSLSGGEQQMLAFGRALMSAPKVLLLDEPSLGLAPLIVQSLFTQIAAIRDDGITVLMAEQNARQALRIADYAYLLENGEIRGYGTAREMEQREDVRAAYLGA